MSRYRRFKIGQRVVLKAKRSERWKEELGTVVSGPAADDIYQILMEKKRSSEEDDVRMVHASLLKPKLRIQYCSCGHSIAAHHSGRCSECSCLRFLDETKKAATRSGSPA